MTAACVHRDPLNHSPSCRLDKQKSGSASHFSSFDFLGGEDSGDDDSDELYDSDQISEMEEFGGSYSDPHTSGGNGAGSNDNGSDSHDDETASYTPRGTSGLYISSHEDDYTGPQTARAAPPTPLFNGSDHGFNRSAGRAPASGLRSSRGVQKMGRNIGKAVGGGISKVGRSILHVGKSQVHSSSSGATASSSSHAKASGADPVEPGAASLLAAGYAFSSESQTSKSYVCGYLHKVSDGKWSKRSWHRRWFVLDKQQGVLSYYRHNPANLLSAAPHGNIVHMDETDDDDGDRDSGSGGDHDRASSSSASPSKTMHEQQPSVASATGKPSNRTDAVAKPALDTTDHAHDKHQNLLYLCKTHPWYRGEFDLNADSVSLLFEKSLAKSAPTSYFFQVSTLSLHEIDSKRGVQYKVPPCAMTLLRVGDGGVLTNSLALTRHDAAVRRQRRRL